MDRGRPAARRQALAAAGKGGDRQPEQDKNIYYLIVFKYYFK